MKKFISLMLCLASFQAFAVSPYTESFKLLIDELHYNLAVEWDQRDLSKRDEFTKQFIKEVQELKKQGMSQTEMEKIISSISNSTNQDQQIQQTIIQNLKTERELIDYIYGNKNLYDRGANWNGNIDWARIGFASAFILGIAIIVVGWSAAFGAFDKKEPYTGPQGPACLEYKPEVCSTSCNNYWDDYYQSYYEKCEESCYTECARYESL